MAELALEDVPIHDDIKVLMALQVEIRKNEQLCRYLLDKVQDSDDMMARMLHIATYYKQPIEGEYTPLDMAKKLYPIVRADNSPLILPLSAHTLN